MVQPLSNAQMQALRVSTSNSNSKQSTRKAFTVAEISAMSPQTQTDFMRERGGEVK